MTIKRIPLDERFWKLVNKTDGCWLWTGATNHFGYGMINSGGHSGNALRAHRVSWIIHNGVIPNGRFICHHCDNPSCVRPDHLFIGTCADNNRDMVAKNRCDRVKRPRGEKHGNHLLYNKQVLDIRAAYKAGNTSLHKLGAQYSVSYMTIWHIVKRHSWAHI